MGAFLVLCVLGLVAFVIVGAIASAVLHAFVWLVTLPFRIVFKLLFGLGGILAGLVLAPFIAVIAAIFGFTGIAGTAAWFAQVVFFIALIVFLVSLVFGRRVSI